MNDRKDNRIELYRFIFAVIIMVFHAHNINNGQGHPIPLGHVFVEFFFFLTGYFTYAGLAKKPKDNMELKSYPLQYTIKKFKRFRPYIIMTASLYLVTSLVYDQVIKHIKVCDSLLEFTGLPFDVLLLQVTGISKNPSFNAWWYLSAILFTLPLVIILFYKKTSSDGGVEAYIVYFIPLLIYGAFSIEISGLDWDREVFGIIKSGIFRGFAGLCMGCTIYDLKNRLNTVETTIFNQTIFTIMEIASYMISFLIAWKWNEVTNSTFLIVLLLTIGLVITFSNKSFTVRLNFGVFSYLGMISMPLYICHYSVGRLIGRYYVNDNIFDRYVVYFICSLAFAICMLVVDRILIKRGA